MLDATILVGRPAAPRPRPGLVTVLALLSFAVAAGMPRASLAQSDTGVQVTPDTNRVLVSKDVGDERWAITRNDDGTVTGNVFRSDGGDPSFVWCEQTGGDDDDFFDDFLDFLDDLIGDDDDDDGNDDELQYRCFGADRCENTPCTTDEWSFIADVSLPESFFRP